MKAIVTGMNGTVAPALARALAEAGHEVVAWDRAAVPIDDPAAVHGFIAGERPDGFFHVATGPVEWAEEVAQVCAEGGVRFLLTGSVSVFSAAQRGPFGVDARPEPDDGYGRYKLDAERRVRAAHPEALVARLGWQIGTAPGGNQMVDYLDRTAREQGRIEAGVRWYPACSFLTDTAAALVALMTSSPGGLYHLDGNPGRSFFEIATGLNRLLGEPWRVEPSPTPEQNNRLLDERVPVAPITRRLPP